MSVYPLTSSWTIIVPGATCKRLIGNVCSTVKSARMVANTILELVQVDLCMKENIITDFTSYLLVHDARPSRNTHSMRPQRDIVYSRVGDPSRNAQWLFCVASHRIPTIMTQHKYVRTSSQNHKLWKCHRHEKSSRTVRCSVLIYKISGETPLAA